MYVMEAIYDKHRENPSLELNKKTYETIKKVLEESCYSEEVLNIFSDIEYQLNSQKNKTAAFELDCAELLLCVKKNIIENEEVYKLPEDMQHPNGIWNEVLAHSATMEQITGQKNL